MFNEYLDKLYTQIFTVTDLNRKSIGNIVKEVARQTKLQKQYTYNVGQNSRIASYYDADRANVHQVLLQGDPAVAILITDGALPVDLITFTAKPENDKVRVEWLTASEKNNSHFIVERSYKAQCEAFDGAQLYLCLRAARAHPADVRQNLHEGVAG